jgi:hypothetical protein
MFRGLRPVKRTREPSKIRRNYWKPTEKIFHVQKKVPCFRAFRHVMSRNKTSRTDWKYIERNHGLMQNIQKPLKKYPLSRKSYDVSGYLNRWVVHRKSWGTIENALNQLTNP